MPRQAKYLRANPPWTNIPIVVVSEMDDLRRRVRDLKPVACLKKPVDPDVLTATVARYC